MNFSLIITMITYVNAWGNQGLGKSHYDQGSKCHFNISERPSWSSGCHRVGD